MSPIHHHPESRAGLNWPRINQWLLWLGLAAAVAWLFFGHSAHLLQIAPFLILLACPLMHIFGHGGHGGHAEHRRDEELAPPKSAEQPKRGTSSQVH
jgi:hypothetical protein